MIKIKPFLVLFFCVLCARFACAQNYGGAAELMEFSVYGGISASDTEKEVKGVKADFGGGGYGLGLTGLAFVNDYFAAGIDFSYLNNGYGKEIDFDGVDADFRLERYRPLFLAKVYLLPPSKSAFSVYVPLGAGLEFARVSKRIKHNDGDKRYDTLAGLALSAGMGAEFNFYNGTFIAAEGRYDWARFIGSNDYGLNRAGGFAGVIKFGMRFNADYDFWD